jgi:O-antigen/teichoic acid export membrane protein
MSPVPDRRETSSASPGRALARSASFLLFAQAVSTGLAVVLSGALGRQLGSADFGLFFLVNSMCAFALVVAEWGQYQYVVRELSRDPGRAPGLLGDALAARTAAAVALGGLAALSALLLGYGGRTAWLTAFMAAAMIPFFLAQAHTLVFRSRERMELEAIVVIVDKALTLGFTLAALWLGLGLPGVVAALGAGGLGALAIALLLVWRLGLRPRAPRWEGVRELVRGGASMALLSAESSAQTYLDPVLLSKLAPPEALGWYGAARRIAGTLVAPAIVLEVSCYPRLSRSAADIPRFRVELRAALRPALAIGALVLVGTLLFGPAVVEVVFGERNFAQAGRILQFMAPVVFLYFVDNVLSAAAIAAGRARALVIAKVASLLATAAMAVALVPLLEARAGNGALGLVLASGLGELVMLGTALAVMPKGALDPRLGLDLGRTVLAGAGALALVRVLPGLPLVAGILTCTAGFAGLGLAFGLVRLDELRALLRRS